MVAPADAKASFCSGKWNKWNMPANASQRQHKIFSLEDGVCPSVWDEFAPFSELNTTCSQDEAAGMFCSLYSVRSVKLPASVPRSMEEHSTAVFSVRESVIKLEDKYLDRRGSHKQIQWAWRAPTWLRISAPIYLLLLQHQIFSFKPSDRSWVSNSVVVKGCH